MKKHIHRVVRATKESKVFVLVFSILIIAGTVLALELSNAKPNILNAPELSYKSTSPAGPNAGTTVPASCESGWNGAADGHGGLCCVPNNGTSCTSAANACGAVGYGTIQCDGSCSAVTPFTTAGQSCTSASNSCGVVGYGTIQCDGSCNAAVPPLIAGYGSSCTSAANACGMTSTGTIQCNGSCSAVTPADTLCPSPTVSLSLTPSSIPNKGSFRLSYTSTHASSCDVSGAAVMVGAPTSYDWGTISGYNGPDTKSWTVSCASAYSPSIAPASASRTLTVAAPTCTPGVCTQGCPQECAQGAPNGGCADPAYAAANPSICGRDPDVPVNCSNPTYYAANLAECNPESPVNNPPTCLDQAYYYANPAICGENNPQIINCTDRDYATQYPDRCTGIWNGCTDPTYFATHRALCDEVTNACNDPVWGPAHPALCLIETPPTCGDGVCRQGCPANCNLIPPSNPPLPPIGAPISTITTFKISPKLVRSNKPATISWTIDNPSGCSITNTFDSSTVTIPNAAGTQTGQITVNISRKTTFTLTCGASQMDATVSVYDLVEF